MQNTKVLIINFGDENQEFALNMVSQLRNKNISSELYPDNAKMKKQMSYADKNRIPFVIIAGAKEIEDNKVTIKDMQSGEQQICLNNKLLSIISQKLN
jgi:histidyl-tRNA synthetase